VLTPEEFVAAGDLLVDKCPSWSWEAGDPAKVELPHALCPLCPRRPLCHRILLGHLALAIPLRASASDNAESQRLCGSMPLFCTSLLRSYVPYAS
jgi:hypothetical protein